MVVVLADDFSGAAEIGGIGHRYGLQSEVQLALNKNTHADLVVVDTDTRSLSEAEAFSKISEIGAALKKWDRSIRLFKKIDSVMRGHLIPEINALHEYFQFNNVLLMSANPSRGRKIIDGRYWINDTPLHQTVFAHDPYFPVVSSEVADRVKTHPSALRHVHLKADNNVGSGTIITGDASSKADLKKFVSKFDDSNLCCGAADLFESYLENLGYKENANRRWDTQLGSRPFTFIVNGSTVKNTEEQELYHNQKIPVLSLPGGFVGDQFHLSQEEQHHWHKKVLEALHMHKKTIVTIDHPIQHNKLLSENFLSYFVELFRYITENIGIENIHFCLTGGATASAIIRRLNEDRLCVKEEIIPGVVSLVLRKGENDLGYFTVKPGSYAWPERLMKHIADSK